MRLSEHAEKLPPCRDEKRFAAFDTSSMLELWNRTQQDSDYDSMTTGCRYIVRPIIVMVYLIVAVLCCQIASGDETRRPPQPPQAARKSPIQWGETIEDEVQGSADVVLADLPLTDAELVRHSPQGSRLIQIATAVTAVVPAYDVAGLQEPLRFSSETLAGIFLGTITRWNDPAIAALNPAARLPAAEIRVIGHAKADGSTYTWTDFLSKTNTEWLQLTGPTRSLHGFPAFGQGETATDLAQLVKQTPNSITYLEFWATGMSNLQVGRVEEQIRQLCRAIVRDYRCRGPDRES